MAKFTFPISSRRSKQQLAPAFVSDAAAADPALPNSFSKAHKILGGASIQTLPAQSQQPRDEDPDQAGIGSGALERTQRSHRVGSKLLRLRDDGIEAAATWDPESELVPTHERSAPADPLYRMMAELGSPAPDASQNLYQEHSNTSMRDRLDKSRLSQQVTPRPKTLPPIATQRLPQKASTLLDMENQSQQTLPSPVLPAKYQKKKKPHGLDLAHLLGRRRDKSIENDISETDFEAHNSIPSPIRQGRHWRKSEHSGHTRPRPLTTDPDRRLRTDETMRMDRMYHHYEAMAQRDNPDAEDDVPPVPSLLSETVRTTTATTTEPAAAVDFHKPRPSPESGAFAAPAVVTPQGSSHHSDVASLSSRQTAASRHTSKSNRVERDLLMTSILSLSSSSEGESDDSEDDQAESQSGDLIQEGGDEDDVPEGVGAFLVQAARGTAPVMAYASDCQPMDMSVAGQRASDVPVGLFPLSQSAKPKRESYASVDTYLTVPSQSASRKSKSTAPSTQGSPWAAQKHSRLSFMSASTTASASSWASAPRRDFSAPAYLPPTAALPNIPTQQSRGHPPDVKPPATAGSMSSGFSYDPTPGPIRPSQSLSQLPPTLLLGPHNLLSDRSPITPPLTPAAIDAFMLAASVNQPASGSLHAPNSAVPSRHSFLDDGDNDDGDRSPRATGRNEGPASLHSSRYMAVSRQEELLLAALRQKRALMGVGPQECNPLPGLDNFGAEGAATAHATTRSDSRSSHASSATRRIGAASRSSARTVTEHSSFDGDAPVRSRTGNGTNSHGEYATENAWRLAEPKTPPPLSSRLSSSAVSRTSGFSGKAPISIRSQNVPLYLDDSSIVGPISQYDNEDGRHSQSTSWSRPQQTAPMPMRSSSRSPLSLTIVQYPSPSRPDSALLDGRVSGQGDATDEELSSESGSEEDTAFQFPVPGGRGSIQVGIASASSSRSSSLRKHQDLSQQHRSSQRSAVVTSPAFGNQAGRRSAVGDAQSTILEDEVLDATTDDSWPPLTSLQRPPQPPCWPMGTKYTTASADAPRPDSPPLAPMELVSRKKTAARLSAVGGRSGEPGWWGHDG